MELFPPKTKSRWVELMRKHPRTKRLPLTDLMCEKKVGKRPCKRHARWRYTFLKSRGEWSIKWGNRDGQTVYVCSSHLESHCINGDMAEYDAAAAWYDRLIASGKWTHYGPS